MSDETTAPETLSQILASLPADKGDDAPEETPPDEPQVEADKPDAEGDAEAKKPDEDKAKKEEFSAIARRERRAKERALREIKAEREALEKARGAAEEERRAAAFAKALATEKSMLRRAELAGIDIQALAEEMGIEAPPERAIDDRVERALREREKAAEERRRQEAAQQGQKLAEDYIAHVNASAPDLLNLAHEMGWSGHDFVMESARIEALVEKRGGKIRSFDDLANAVRKVYKLTSPSAPADANEQRENSAPEQVTEKPGNRATPSLTSSRAQRGADADDASDERTGAALRRLAGL